MSNKTDLIPAVSIEKKIMLLRGQKVMLDSDLAALYGVGNQGAQSGCETQPRTLPGGLHVST